MKNGITDIKKKMNLTGAECLSDEELITIILGEKACSTLKDIARLSDSSAVTGETSILSPLLGTDQEAFRCFGMSLVPAMRLECVTELSKRLWKVSKTQRIIRTVQDIADLYMQDLRGKAEEYAYILLVNSKGRMIKSIMVGKGSCDSCSLSIRGIMKEVILNNASGFALIHNHPSGMVDPSSDDIALSKKLRDAADCLNVKMLDSIIIGDNIFCSLSEKGIL